MHLKWNKSENWDVDVEWVMKVINSKISYSHLKTVKNLGEWKICSCNHDFNKNNVGECGSLFSLVHDSKEFNKARSRFRTIHQKIPFE